MYIALNTPIEHSHTLGVSEVTSLLLKVGVSSSEEAGVYLKLGFGTVTSALDCFLILKSRFSNENGL